MTIDAALAEKIGGRRVVASVSGGKDSAAMSLWLAEQGIEHERVHCLTGWEWSGFLDYLRGELTRVIGPITEIRGDLLMPDLIRKKAMFPQRTRRFCTQELKIKPLRQYIARRIDAGDDVVNAIGIRAAESEARARMTEWEESDDFDCTLWRPLLHWTEAEVIAMHTRHGLRPNPLYLMGASRVGCWPCIFARKSEIRMIADMEPARIDEIRALEAEATKGVHARAAAKGEELRGNDPAFFQTPLRDAHGKHGRCMPIDEVVAWSRTARGGRQTEMFAAGPTEAGCMRWGLCETE